MAEFVAQPEAPRTGRTINPGFETLDLNQNLKAT